MMISHKKLLHTPQRLHFPLATTYTLYCATLFKGMLNYSWIIRHLSIVEKELIFCVQLYSYIDPSGFMRIRFKKTDIIIQPVPACK